MDINKLVKNQKNFFKTGKTKVVEIMKIEIIKIIKVENLVLL